MFESKYLLRYGIPGWVLIIGILAYFIFSDLEIMYKLIENNTLTLVGIGAVLAGIGVPLGFIIHQISLFFSWVLIKDWEDFFEDELQLDIIIINDEKGKEIRERYRYLLSQLHGTKALKTSSIITFLINLILLITYKFNTLTILLNIVIMLIIFIIHRNQKYTQENLNYFLKNIYRIVSNKSES